MILTFSLFKMEHIVMQLLQAVHCQNLSRLHCLPADHVPLVNDKNKSYAVKPLQDPTRAFIMLYLCIVKILPFSRTTLCVVKGIAKLKKMKKSNDRFGLNLCLTRKG